MKRLFVVLALALALPGCGVLRGSVLKNELRLGGGGAESPTVKRVAVFLRACPEDVGSPCEAEAERWLLESAVSHADAMELIALAREAVARERAKARCEGRSECSGL